VFEPLLSAEEAASLLIIHPETLRRWARSGQVPCIRMGRRIAFRTSLLNTWLESKGYTTDGILTASTERTSERTFERTAA
jgi:excisionase family DNA binding protein